MQSFVAAPQVHVSALKNSAMIGGPFINYDANKQQIFADLPEKIEYVLITHAHHDHMMFATLLQLRHQIRNII
jgi:L-ascorbate metabolism protein UlaG (beta-lactamase superfamily)